MTAYDRDSRVLETAGPDGAGTVYTYDELGRPVAAARGGMSAALEYFADSSLRRVDYGNGAASLYEYDAARRLTAIEHRDAGDGVVHRLDYDWSLAGLVKARTETRPDGTWRVDFEYDRRGRLTRESRVKISSEPEVVEYDIAYAYDQLGNRTERIDHVAERMTTYSYDVDVSPESLEYPTRHNRLLWYEVYDTSGVSNQLLRRVQYTYYDNGQVSNITLKDEGGDPNAAAWHYDLALHYYTHGPLQRAVWGRWRDSQEGPTDYEVLKAREFRYDDPRARYLSVDIATPDNNPGLWTLDRLRWTDYEGVTPYGDFDVDPNDIDDPLLSVRYFGFSGEHRIDPNDPNAEIDVTYWHEDLIGSIMQTTDAAGDQGGRGAPAGQGVSYTAFGEPIGDFASMPRYQYAGQYGYESGLLTLEGADPTLPPIALQHLGWRWYQPDIGRFVQRDPIGIGGGKNVYLYCGNNPVLVVDPLGLWSLLPTSWNDSLAEGWRWLLGDDYLAGASDAELVVIATGTSVAIAGGGYGAYWFGGWLCGGGWAQVGINTGGVVIRSAASRAGIASAPWAIHLGNGVAPGNPAISTLPLIPVRYPDLVTGAKGFASNCFWGALQGIIRGF